MGVTKLKQPMGTKLKRIAVLSSQDPKMAFKWLMPHVTKENLICCFNELDGRKAVGIDGKTKEVYARELEANIELLISKMKRMAYKPFPVREVLIPKGDGKYRPLGISNIEDKIVQMMFGKILESIYEPIFRDCSYGFRRDKNAHMAIRETIRYIKFNNVKRVIDVDIENFFGTIKHKDLLKMLSLKIKDRIFLRYISRMLKAGTVTEKGIDRKEIGLAQGSIASPILANVYAHYVIDLWFDKVVPKHIIGKVAISRYADDLIVCCTDTRDVYKIKTSLTKRLSKFGLSLNLEKSKIVRFNKWDYGKGIKQEVFSYLGFTFYLSKARKESFTTVKVKTNKKTLRTKLKLVSVWVKQNRFNGTIRDIWCRFRRKLGGHIAYFGVTNNADSVKAFLHRARRIFFKWMNRRSQRRSLNWEQFILFEKQYPMPMVKIYHQAY